MHLPRQLGLHQGSIAFVVPFSATRLIMSRAIQPSSTYASKTLPMAPKFRFCGMGCSWVYACRLRENMTYSISH
jgi:hypothetical protein